jgi:hypothetical protein
MDRAEDAERRERNARAMALPLALVGAWVAVTAAPGPVRLITMWLHESGHAVTAWMCGYAAWPGPWFTPIGGDRSAVFSILLVGTLGWGAYRAWQIERWFWVASASAALLAVLSFTMLLSPASAQQLITFGGDAGNLVLGTALMLTIYARHDHPIRTNQVRWGLLAVGALAFMDTYLVWTGPMSNLPFGENENGLSDPSVLVEGYGWTSSLLVARYRQVANGCMAVLVVTYASALVWPLFALSNSRSVPMRPVNDRRS